MTKEVLLSVRGLQMGERNQQDVVETISPGQYYFRNGKHFLLYEEVIEGSKKTTKNMIKVSEDYMELTKKGEINVHMIFEKNKKNVTYYYTPFGSLLMGIDAYRVEVHETEEQIFIEVEYSLDLNNEHLANCHIQIKATPRRSSNNQYKLS